MTLKEYVVSHIVNLIKIKSILTLALTAAFVILALSGQIAPDQFLVIFTTVIGFYFGSNTSKTEQTEEAKEDTQKDEEVKPIDDDIKPIETEAQPITQPIVEAEEYGYHEE